MGELGDGLKDVVLRSVGHLGAWQKVNKGSSYAFGYVLTHTHRLREKRLAHGLTRSTDY